MNEQRETGDSLEEVPVEKCITCHGPATHAVAEVHPDERYGRDPWWACDQHVGRFAVQRNNFIVKRLENR